MVSQFKTLKPLGDRVLVKIEIVEEKSRGGILLPSTAQTKPQGGQVVAVGEGKTVGDKKIELSVKVIFCPYGGALTGRTESKVLTHCVVGIHGRLGTLLSTLNMLAQKWNSMVQTICFSKRMTLLVF